MKKFFIIFQIFIFSINLNINSPLIVKISNFYELNTFQGFLYIGGFNNFLIFIPIALGSLYFAFAKRSLGIFSLSILLTVCNLFLGLRLNLFSFYTANLGIGIGIGMAIPILYQMAREIEREGNSIFLLISINVAIGIGLVFGQYMAAIAVDQYPNQWNSIYFMLAFAFLLNTVYVHFQSLDRYQVKEETLTEGNILKVFKENPNAIRTQLLLSQYLPGSVPWGALSVFLFPYFQEAGIFTNIDVANFLTILSIGMIAGSFSAGYVQKSKIGNSNRKILYLILLTFLFSTASLVLLIQNFEKLSFLALASFFLIVGFVLAFPGTYIKALLYLNHNSQEVKSVFAIENFLESIGKGLGPLVVSFLIIQIGDYKLSFSVAAGFWLICILPICRLIYLEKESE
jgi:MFS family permease